MRVRCRTNLDIQDAWPTDMDAVPRVGDMIEALTAWKGWRVQLLVAAVTWRQAAMGYYAELELTVPAGMTLRQFYEMYAPRVGRRPEDFI